MKITFFIGSLYGGGAERVTCNLASYLVRHGHQAEILTMSETEESYELDEKVTVRTLLPLNERKNTYWNNLMRFPRFWNYLRKTKNDIYVVMLPKTIIMFMMFRWMTKAKVVAAERVDPNIYKGKTAELLKKYAKRADGFVFQTEDAMKWYEGCLGNCRTTVIPNAINRVFIRPEYAGERRKVIAAAGRLTYQKDFALLIRAFSKIAHEFPEYRLVIYGEGRRRGELEELIRELSLEQRVSLPGNISGIEKEMEQNSMFVLSSKFEGMPNALMEAMALGLPCISTDCPCGGPRFLIRSGVNGILVPAGDADKMAEEMKRVLENKELREVLGRNAMKIREELAPEKIYRKWEEFLQSIASS